MEWKHQQDEFEKIVYLSWMNGQLSHQRNGMILDKHSQEFKATLNKMKDLHGIKKSIEIERNIFKRWKLIVKQKFMTWYNTSKDKNDSRKEHLGQKKD